MNARPSDDGKGKQGFFTVDRRTWSAICDLDDINAAIAYLVLANGTGRSNSRTYWSAQSLKTWTDMPWRCGREAISKLIDRSFVDPGERHSRSRPVYELPAWETQVHPLFDWDLPSEISNPPLTAESTPSAELIWLPNSLITGSDSGEMPPLKKLRLAGDVWALCLLIDLYHSHHLESDSGVRSDLLHENYERLRVGEQGSSVVWGFVNSTRTITLEGSLENHGRRPRKEDGSHPVWQSIDLLEKMGLISFVPHLYPNSRFEEPLHSLGEVGKGAESEEEELRIAASTAAAAMLQPEQIDWAYCEGGYELLVPAPSWLEDVQVRGVARLRYRPHTNATARWHRTLMEVAPGWICQYNELRDKAYAAKPAKTP